MTRYFVPLYDDELPCELGKLYVVKRDQFIDPDGALLVTIPGDLIVEIPND